MWIELHCHSTRSDGSEEPAAVARRAQARGVELFSLTDHDTMSGCDEARATFGDVGFLRGVELSCYCEGRTVHLLVYEPLRDSRSIGWDGIEERLGELASARRGRLRAMAERLAALGAPVDVEAIMAEAGDRSVGRPHLARALVASGAVRSTDEAFARYLHDRGPAHIPLVHLSLEEGLSLGRRAGARMSLAHPHILGELAPRLLRRLRREGLEGVEACYASYRREERQRWIRLAEELDLVVTGGSDFHGESSSLACEPGVDLAPAHAGRLRAWLGV